MDCVSAVASVETLSRIHWGESRRGNGREYKFHMIRHAAKPVNF